MKSIFNIILLIVMPFLAKSQCFTADSTIWVEPWESCTMSANPNEMRGESHWILYDFGETRNLSRTWVWNANDPSKLANGFKEVNIDYSSDQINWKEWGAMSFQKGTGEAIYAGFLGPDLEGINAQFILITVISTYGASDCASLTEIKFNLLPDGYLLDEGCVVNPALNNKTFNITETSVDFYYEAAANCDATCKLWFEYRVLGAADWIIVTDPPLSTINDLSPGTIYEYRVATEKDCDPSNPVYTPIDTFKTLGTSSINSLSNEKAFRIFPNPSSDRLVVVGNLNSTLSYHIFNNLGQMVMTGILDNNQYSIQIGELKSGIYSILLGNETLKLVKL